MRIVGPTSAACLTLLLGFTVTPVAAAERPSAQARLGSEQFGEAVDLSTVQVLRERVGAQALIRQHSFLAAMPAARVEYAPRGGVRHITGSTGVFLRDGGSKLKAGDDAQEILTRLTPALLAKGSEKLRVTSVNTISSSNERVVKLEESIRGLPVLSGQVKLGISLLTGEITTVTAAFLSDYGLPIDTRISEKEAKQQLLATLRGAQPNLEVSLGDRPSRLAYAHGPPGSRGAMDSPGHLVWIIEMTEGQGDERTSKQAWVDASTGDLLGSVHTMFSALNRRVYSANNQMHNWGQLPTPLYNAYLNIFNRDSMDGAGGRINIAVHWGTNYGNAHHTRTGGQHFLLFGDGSSGQMPYGSSLDVVAHEFGHGVVAVENNFDYFDTTIDSGAALHEAFADFSSTVVDTWTHGVPTTSTWTIGKVWPANSTQGKRYLHLPVLASVNFRDWYPRRRLSGTIDGGQQYHNSTIMGHALYLLTNGGTHYRAGLPGSEVPVINVPAIGYQSTRDVFYDALRGSFLQDSSGFLDVRYATIQAAPDPATRQAVAAAWDAVGVGYGCSSPPVTPVLDMYDFYCYGMYRLNWASVPGASLYHAQRVPANLPWSLAQTIVEGQMNECMQQVTQMTYVRLRACNGCGCCAWSPAQTMVVYPQCM